MVEASDDQDNMSPYKVQQLRAAAEPLVPAAIDPVIPDSSSSGSGFILLKTLCSKSRNSRSLALEILIFFPTWKSIISSRYIFSWN